MRRLFIVVAAFVLCGVTSSAQTTKTAKSDADIKQDIIRESIAGYSGSCPCPYSRDRAGRSCGKRSAYSRPGGASPVCYEDDVTAKMVESYRAAHGEKQAPVAQTKGSSTSKEGRK